MAEARIDEEEEELRELRDPGVRRNLRQSSPATGRTGRNKPERRVSSQGPLSSIRSAIKRTSTRTNSQGDHSRERRRPEITILSAEPLATNAWFSGAPAGFPPPPPPTEHIWGGSIPAAAQPPPSYEEVIREKTQEQAPPPPPAVAPSRLSTTTIATQTDFVPEEEAEEPSELQCKVTLQAIEKKTPGGGRHPRPPRPSFPPKALPSATAANSSGPLGESPVSLSEEQTLNDLCTAEAINSPLITSCEFLPCPLTPGSVLQTEPCEPLCLISLDFPSASIAASSALLPSSEPPADGQPQENSRRPTPRPRSKDVKVQTLVRLKDYGESAQESPGSGAVLSSKYLLELLDVFGSGELSLGDRSDRSSESEQIEQNDLSDQNEEDSMSILRSKIQAFKKQGSAEDVDGEPAKSPEPRPEPRPRAQHSKPPPVAARPAVPTKPSLTPTPLIFGEEASGPCPRPETNYHKECTGAPTPAPRPLLPKKPPTESGNKEASANLTRPPRPSIAARPKNPVAREEGCAASRPAPPVQSKVLVDLLDLSSPLIDTEPAGSGPDCEISKTTSNDVPTKPEQPLVAVPDRPSVPLKPTVIRVSSKPSKSVGDVSAEPAPPLPTQNPVGGLAPQLVPKSSLTPKSNSQPSALECANADKPGGSSPLPPRPPVGKIPPPRPLPAKTPPGRPPPPQTVGHKRSQSRGGLKKGPPLPPRPCPGHPLYNSYAQKKNESQVLPKQANGCSPERDAADVHSREPSSSTKTSASLIDTSSSAETQSSSPKQTLGESCGLQVQVLHDFTPDGPGELALKAGDVVSMVERVDSDWCRGTCKGSSGIFPVNHVKPPSCSPANGKKEAPVAAAVSGPRCVARFDYEAERGDELSFSEGAVIGLKERVDLEWARGELGGRTGVFPLNFVEVVEDLPASVERQSDKKTTELPGLATSPQIQEPPKLCESGPSEEEWALALFDFTAQTDEDLSFKQGARILITEHVDSDWCCGRLGGKEGLFPKAFVQINCTAQAAERPHSEPGGGRRAKALFSFTSECVEELSVQVGDVMSSLESIDEEWFFCELRGARGLIPKNYVQVLQDP